MQKGLRVLLVDDHALVRAGLRALLETLGGVQVVGEASDGREALRSIETLRPDVVLMDIAMAGMNGLEAAARATQAFPRSRIIILSMHADEEYVRRALRAGATGYLLKDAGTAEVKLALEAVADGGLYLSPGVSKHVVDDYARGSAGGPPSEGREGPYAVLTPRQREILQLVAEGSSTKEIARVLDLAVKTVETHRAEIMTRLGIHNVAGLVRYAIRTGIVSPER